jgi:hypothetical protein
MESDETAELIGTLRRIAAELGTDSVSRPEFLRRSGFSERKVQRLFGGYNRFVEAAGLVPRRFSTSDAPMYSDEDMVDEVVRVLRLPGSKLTRIFFEQNSRISTSACERRFGDWINTLKATVPCLDPDQDAALLARLQEYTAPTLALPRRPESTPQPAESHVSGDNDEQEVSPSVAKDRPAPLPAFRGNLYGDFINFRGLQHAPLNEEGVVFLFGMVCRELGYVGRDRQARVPRLRSEAGDSTRNVAAGAHRVRVQGTYLLLTQPRSRPVRSYRVLGGQLARLPSHLARRIDED